MIKTFFQFCCCTSIFHLKGAQTPCTGATSGQGTSPTSGLFLDVNNNLFFPLRSIWVFVDSQFFLNEEIYLYICQFYTTSSSSIIKHWPEPPITARGQQLPTAHLTVGDHRLELCFYLPLVVKCWNMLMWVKRFFLFTRFAFISWCEGDRGAVGDRE